jgi:hypothetical protein
MKEKIENTLSAKKNTGRWKPNLKSIGTDA